MLGRERWQEGSKRLKVLTYYGPPPPPTGREGGEFISRPTRGVEGDEGMPWRQL